MSDLGVLSHVYTEWNSYLNSINLWLFSIRKTLDEASSTKKTITVPKDIHTVLLSIATSIDPNPSRPTSKIPLDLKRKLMDRFRDDAKNVSQRLYELLDEMQIPISEISNTDLEMLNSIVASLDDEVTSLYSRMRRNR